MKQPKTLLIITVLFLTIFTGINLNLPFIVRASPSSDSLAYLINDLASRITNWSDYTFSGIGFGGSVIFGYNDTSDFDTEITTYTVNNDWENVLLVKRNAELADYDSATINQSVRYALGNITMFSNYAVPKFNGDFNMWKRYSLYGYRYATELDTNLTKWNVTSAYLGFKAVRDNEGHPFYQCDIDAETGDTSGPERWLEAGLVASVFHILYEAGATDALDYCVQEWEWLNENRWDDDSHYNYTSSSVHYEWSINDVLPNFAKVHYDTVLQNYSRLVTHLETTYWNDSYDSPLWHSSEKVIQHASTNVQRRLTGTINAIMYAHQFYGYMNLGNQTNFQEMIEGTGVTALWDAFNSSDLRNATGYQFRGTSDGSYSVDSTINALMGLFLMGISPQNGKGLAFPLECSKRNGFEVLTPSHFGFNYTTSSIKIPVGKDSTLKFLYGNSSCQEVFNQTGIYNITFNSDWNTINSTTRLSGLFSDFEYLDLNTVTVESIPTGITFSIDDLNQTTSYDALLPNGTYTILFPVNVTVGSLLFNFSMYEDDSTSLSRSYTATTDDTITAYYRSRYSPINFTGYSPVFQSAMNNMFELDGILTTNDTLSRQMLLDSSPYENHATLWPMTHPYSGPELTWGTIGKALAFDGVDDTAIILNSDSLNITEAITVSTWFMIYNVTDDMDQTLIMAASPYVFKLSVSNGTLEAEIWDSDGTRFANESIYTIQEGIFYHAALTYDFRDAYYTVYMNGVAYANITTSGKPLQTSNHNVYLGSSTNSTAWLYGCLDETKIYPYKRIASEVFTDVRVPIQDFDETSFVYSADSDDGSTWTTQEGIVGYEGHCGFTNNDPSLPFAKANDSNPYQLIRTMRYTAGFQSYQIYCNVKYTTSSTASPSGLSGLYWYWNFFRNGRLQVTYHIEVEPSQIDNDYNVTEWTVTFRRATPYYDVQNVSTYTFDSNESLFPNSIPVVLSAWIGSDNKHFTVRFDVQDARIIIGGDEAPFTESYDLVDSNLNTHIVDWMDGWIVSGIRCQAHKETGGTYSKMEIESHKLFVIAALILTAVIVGGYTAYVMTGGQAGPIPSVIHTVVKEIVTILQPIAEVVGSAVRIIGETVTDALAGLAHDIVAGFGSLSAGINNVFAGMSAALTGLVSNMWAALGAYAEPIIQAFAYAGNSLGANWVSWIDGIFAWFGLPPMFSIITTYINMLWGWLSESFNYAGSIALSIVTLSGSFLGKLLNTVSTSVGYWVSMLNTFYNFLNGSYTAGVNVWNDLNLSTWIPIIAILYPMWLLFKWDEEGIDAVINHVKMMLDIGAWFFNIFLSIIRMAINLITSLIESIPVVE